MSSETEMTRRHLLGQALGAPVLIAALGPLASAAPGGGATQVGGASAPRERQTFDFAWKFFQGDAPGAQAPAFPDSAWRTLDLPHDWSIEGPYGENEPTAGPGGYLPTGVGWYRKRFRLPDSYAGRNVSIEFDGVYENGEVWINGTYLGKRPFGYIGFAYDLTPHLNSGGDNVIAVRVDNSRQPNSRWYSGSGIYRHTWLLSTGNLHIARWGTCVTTPQVSRDSALVHIRTRVSNDGPATARCTPATSILDRGGNPIRTERASQDIAPGSDFEFVQQAQVEKPSLWSVEIPYLYTLRSTVLDQDRLADQYETPLGIREAVFDADRGFLLNGQHVKLNGVCIHHEAGAVGAAVPEQVWKRRLEILKEMGCNSIRTSHNPPAPEFLDLCDSLGFFVMAEAFDEWRVPKGQIGPFGYHLYFDEWSERDVVSFVHRDRNHPSIVLWSAGNEIVDQLDPQGTETLRRLIGIFHREDPTRLVTAGCDQISAEPHAAPQEFLALLDVVGYNYVNRWRDRAEKYYSIDRHAYPGRKMLGTESPGMGGIRGDYSGLFTDDPAAINERTDTEQLWKFVRTYDYVAGDYMWTGIDYLGESRWPSRSSSSGVLDTCGFKKDGFYFYQSQWTAAPMLHLFPHWNWKGREGRVVPVTCYTNCDSVELFLNGRSLGTKGYMFPRTGMELKYGNFPARARVPRTTADLHLTWDVPYEPGTLKAVGTTGGRVSATAQVVTAGEPAAISLSADRQTILANRRDVAHIAVQILDAQGHLAPLADNPIAFGIQGEGKIIGTDNGDPRSHEDFKGATRRAFNGLCLVMVQSAAQPGVIRVTAVSPGLASASIAIATEA